MKTAHPYVWKVRWRISAKENRCSIPTCKRPPGPTYMDLPLCSTCMDRHFDGKLKLENYTLGEHSRIVIGDIPKGVKKLEVVEGDKLMDTISKGDEVAWSYNGKTTFGIVDSITDKNADTVNCTKTTCPISDVVLVWVRIKGGKKLGLVPEEIVPLEEHEESIDDLLNAI